MLKYFSSLTIIICAANLAFATYLCGKNEVPTTCIEAICERRDCSDIGKPIKCIKINPKLCTKGCLCKDTYLRAENGTCIPAEECPPPCGKNEVYDTCLDPCPPRRCDIDDRVVRCVRQLQPGDPKCRGGCRCADNFYKNDKDMCVPRSECPIICRGQNEIPSCEDPCPETCECIGEKCFAKPTDVCIPQCRCKPGYYRNKIGECISKENCLQCTGPYEYFSCGKACDNVCATLKEQNQTNCPINTGKCSPMCYCEEGYARDSKGICIPILKCPPIIVCRGQNEVSGCKSICPQTCESIGEKCDYPYKKDICIPECRCKDGFYRNKIGQCISKENCLKCTGPNEYFACGGACDNVCSTLCEQNQTNCPIKNNKCNPMCYCDEGYARDCYNICVPISKCPLICDGENEVSGCYSTCPQTCESIGKPCSCSLEGCKPECRCRDGYYRNKIGECISKDECLKCSGPHEYFSCGGFCDNVCKTLRYQNQTQCPVVGSECYKMCYCEEGYARNTNKVCIPISMCPPECGMSEVYDLCPPTCPPQTCEAIVKPIKCYLPPLKPGDPNCKPGCRCIDNYYRNKNNVCVPKNKCPKPPVVCGANEVYTSCVNGGCGRWNCSQPEEICIKLPEYACKEGCRCKKGYLRADNGTCIPEDKCPLICDGKNEVSGCYSTCPETCECIGIPCTCPLEDCKPECRCKDGYYRNKIGECISKKDCLKCTGPNEYFSCGGACDNVCATLATQNQTNCPIEPFVCTPMCYCDEGYARDKNNICVPIDKCPLICDGKNEVIGCYSTCPETCECIGIPCTCPLEDCKPECRCKDGFYRNKIGECISKKDCLKCTGPNEYFSCGGACDNVCATLATQNQTNCPIKTYACTPMCYCDEGYARDKNNICVPIDKCPLICDGKNEVIGCYSTCPETCECIGIPCTCPLEDCKPECRCKDGFYRNKIGECISKKDCLKCTGPNEYFSCGGACDNVCATLATQNQTNCPIETCECNPMCYCEEGYARDNYNVCVPISLCPRPKCKINEVFDICPPLCPPQRCDVDPKLICLPNPPPGDPRCKPGCRCINNYVRNKLDVCVPKDQCYKDKGPYKPIMY